MLATFGAACWLCAASAAQMIDPPHADPQTGDTQAGEPQPSQPAVQDQPATVAPPIPTAGDASHDAYGDPLAIFRAPLLREGSSITEAAAHIQRDPNRGWKLIIDQNSKLPVQELILMPCTQLSQMQHIIDAAPERTVQFQVSGKVFVFRGRNYVLPTYAPVLPQAEQQPSSSASADSNVATSQDGQAPAIASGEQPPEAPAPEAPATAPPQRAADIMRDLERAAGPTPRSTSSVPIASDSSASARTASSHSSDASASVKLMPEETPIVNRRGKITRDSGGGWLFVFDADATSLADPPMRLLPCLLLERIEDYARRTGNNSPALLSGPVYLYEGQNYLLPTVFRIPSERKNITP